VKARFAYPLVGARLTAPSWLPNASAEIISFIAGGQFLPPILGRNVPCLILNFGCHAPRYSQPRVATFDPPFPYASPSSYDEPPLPSCRFPPINRLFFERRYFWNGQGSFRLTKHAFSIFSRSFLLLCSLTHRIECPPRENSLFQTLSQNLIFIIFSQV